MSKRSPQRRSRARTTPNDLVYTRLELTRLLKLSLYSVDELIHSGQLKTIHLGRRIFATPEAVRDLLNQPTDSGRKP